MLKARVVAVAVTAAVFGASPHAADNWVRFRGPNGTGISSAKNLPVEFGPANHVKWKTPLPPGHSSPVFTDSHIFLTAHSAEKDAYKLFVLALDRKTGRQLWQHEIPRRQAGRRENVNGPASPGPVTDGANGYFSSRTSTVLYQGVLYMVNDSGILVSFHPVTGDVIKQGRLKGAIDKYFASPIGADGKVWLVSQDGTVSVVTAKGDWEVLQVNTLDDEVFATPVPADGALFIRTRSALDDFAK